VLHPTLWRTCRVLANPVRLRVLQAVVAAPGSCVEEIRQACRIPQSSASHHLRQLQARGLLTARVNGRRVEYLPRTDPAVGHADLVFAAVRAALARNEPPARIGRTLHALTQARRIAIVRALREGPATTDELVARCRISYPAVYRHLHKLLSRTAILQDETGRYLLCEKMPPLCHDLVRIACAG
jgi:DNA-binding transcriptional ArsR family regulator